MASDPLIWKAVPGSNKKAAAFATAFCVYEYKSYTTC